MIAPRVGMVGYHIAEHEAVGGQIRGIPRQAFSMFSYDMVQAISMAGGVAVPLPVVEKKYLKQQISGLQAIVFCGGEDLDPKLYGTVSDAAQDVDPIRDRYEMELMELALATNLPMLCVCRGMQLLNIFFGGTLHADIAESLDTKQSHWETKHPWQTVHSVYLNPDHFVVDIFESTKLSVNSIHHQAIKEIGSGLQIVGKSEDHLVEVLAMEDQDHVLGVQWHPEMIAKKDPSGLKPFQWLIEKSRSNDSMSTR